MAKYRKASEGSKKGVSTDKLSLADAKEYFQGRAKETGAKRFRWNGEVYDLSGNKISETPARSSGSGSRSAASEGPKRPKANPRKAGPAFEEKGRGNAPAPAGKAKGAESPGKRGEANPYAVAGMTAAGVGAGVAAARSGRKPASSSGTSVSDRVRAAGAKAKAAAMGVPAQPKVTPKAEPVKPATTPKTTAPKAGGARVGGAPVGRNLRRSLSGAGIVKMPDVLSLQMMNKGGMVKKKK